MEEALLLTVGAFLLSVGASLLGVGLWALQSSCSFFVLVEACLLTAGLFVYIQVVCLQSGPDTLS